MYRILVNIVLRIGVRLFGAYLGEKDASNSPFLCL
jgi:hypothetical protein